jgi:microcystin-dependent protein
LEATSTTNTFSNSTTNFKDAIVDESITNVLSAFTYFDTNIALMRTASEYRKFWIGMTGDDTNATNRFAIGCNGVNEDQPEILMEIDATGEISMRNGLKIFDLSGDNVGTINNFSDSPKNSTFSIRTNGNLFLESGGINEDPELSRFIDAWSPTLKLGQLKGSTLQMRTDTDNLYKSRIILDKLTLFGGLGSGTNDASIELNGETQNHAYTDADHTAVEGIATIESDITTLQTDLDTAEANIVTLQTDLDTAEANIVTLQNEMEAVEIAVEVNFDQLQEKQYSYNPIGSVQIFAGNALPTGYLWCNGAQISQTTYADLYAVIGYIYSTDRKTSPSAGNFFLPDMRGLFVCGAGAPDSSSFVFNSNTYSKATGDFNEMSVQNHRHTTQTSSGTQSVNIGSATARNNDTQTRLSDVGVFYDDGTTPIVKNATEPFNICMNYIIKY